LYDDFDISWAQVFLWLHVLAVVACVVRVLYKQRNTGTAFAWLIILFVFPVFGVIAYFVIGEPRLGTARAKRSEQMNAFYRAFAEQHLGDGNAELNRQMQQRYQGISHVATSVTGLAPSENNAMRLLTQTDEIIDAMLADIQAAQQTCALAFYIIEPQGKIQTLLGAVRDAAKRGVECTILADAAGSGAFFGSEWEAQLREAGVRIVPALPVGVFKTFFARSDLRNHRKILIVDNLIAYTGSFNLVDPRFFKQGAGVGEWVDVMMRCRGEMVLELAAVFYADVAVEADEHLVEVQREIEKLDEMRLERNRLLYAAYDKLIKLPDEVKTQVVHMEFDTQIIHRSNSRSYAYPNGENGISELPIIFRLPENWSSQVKRMLNAA